MSLKVRNLDGLTIEELVDWINRGMQDYCEFDYCEIEDKGQDEDLFEFELRIILEERLSAKQSTQQVIKALREYCDFDDVDLFLLEEHDGIWVTDDYGIPQAN